MSSGLTQLTSAEIQTRVNYEKLFGVEDLYQYLFRFCQISLTANDSQIRDFIVYGLNPSVLLYGPPNTGKTTLCYLLFNQLKQKVNNEINFYSIDVGRMLDPALGQSSRNLEEIFEELKAICQKGSSVFLLLDELDTFCMSRSRTQEHDAIRRAMTTLMLQLDQLHPTQTRNLLVFGITNVPDLIDTAVVRRFSLKRLVKPNLSFDTFRSYLEYLNLPIKYQPKLEHLNKLYAIYNRRQFTPGDIKSLYKELYVDYLCENISENLIEDRILQTFENGFSTCEHLLKTKEELS